MKLKRYNKATAAMLAGATATTVSAFVMIDGETLAALQTLLTAILVWLAPNET